jgi:hypothetical protein
MLRVMNCHNSSHIRIERNEGNFLVHEVGKIGIGIMADIHRL